MLKNNIVVLFICLSLFSSGCITRETLENYEPIHITEFEEVKDYEIDLTQLDGIKENSLEKLLNNQLYAKITDDGNFEIVFDEEESNAIVLFAEDWASVADLAEISDTYRNIILAQAELINVKNETIRSLQRLVKLQEESKLIYMENFKTSNALYKQEHKIRIREKVFSDIRFFATVAGIIAVGVL